MNKWTGGTLLAGLSLVGLPALAQDVESLNNGANGPAEQEMQAPENGGRLPITATAGLSEQFNSMINDTSASFSVTRLTTGVVAPVRLNDDFQLGNSFRYEMDSCNFNSYSANFPAAPWHNINTVSLASVLKWRMDETWTFYGGGFMKMAADSGAELEDGITGGGLPVHPFRLWRA